jgi:hypothetical protein
MKFSRTTGGSGQHKIYAWLSNQVGPTRAMPYGHPWDFEVNGLRIEAKCSSYSKGRWNVNIHRHGILNEKVDFYVVRLEGCPFWKNAIHLVLKAPLNKHVINISPRSLMVTWGRFVNDIVALGANPTRRKWTKGVAA